MTKYIIWTPGKPRTSLPPDTVYLRLVQSVGHRSVTLVACNPDGSRYECGNILMLNSDGQIQLLDGIHESIPIDRTDADEVVTLNADSDRIN